MNKNLKIEGMEDLHKSLQKLAKKVDNKETTETVYNAANTIVKPAVQSNASGAIKDAVLAKKMPVSDTFPAMAITAIDRKKAPHAHLFEMGSGPRYHSNGKYVGEMPPRPFFRPGVDASMPRALRYIESELKKKVNS